MQQINPANDPHKEKTSDENVHEENLVDEEVVYVVNDDGTPFDTSDRTYVSVEEMDDTPEDDSTTTDDDE